MKSAPTVLVSGEALPLPEPIFTLFGTVAAGG